MAAISSRSRKFKYKIVSSSRSLPGFNVSVAPGAAGVWSGVVSGESACFGTKINVPASNSEPIVTRFLIINFGKLSSVM